LIIHSTFHEANIMHVVFYNLCCFVVYSHLPVVSYDFIVSLLSVVDIPLLKERSVCNSCVRFIFVFLMFLSY